MKSKLQPESAIFAGVVALDHGYGSAEIRIRRQMIGR
jgi:hypothetical protein